MARRTNRKSSAPASSAEGEAASSREEEASAKDEALLASLFAIGTEPSALGAAPQYLDDDGVWVQNSGCTPLEFLTKVYRHPLVQMKERISAARAVLDVVHRKLPARAELTGKDGAPFGGPLDLSKLTDKELLTLRAIIDKAQPAPEGGS